MPQQSIFTSLLYPSHNPAWYDIKTPMMKGALPAADAAHIVPCLLAVGCTIKLKLTFLKPSPHPNFQTLFRATTPLVYPQRVHRRRLFFSLFNLKHHQRCKAAVHVHLGLLVSSTAECQHVVLQ